MIVRATIELDIDIEEAREMGLEIADNEVENYARETAMDTINSLLQDGSLEGIITVSTIEEEANE